MGAGASDLAGMEPSGKVARTGLDDLPELCAAEVLLHLDAPDICRLARLNRAFRGAAAADFVWEAKLPENYGPLLRFVDGAEGGEMGKKDIFARLAKPVPFDGGRRVRFFSHFLVGLVPFRFFKRSPPTVQEVQFGYGDGWNSNHT
jgi:hypothetical protein